MGGAANRTLFLRPTQSVQAERGPMIVGIAAGINFLSQTQEDQVSGLMRAEAGDLDIVAEQVGILRDLVDRAAEKLLLIIEAGTPGQVCADLQILTHAMADHVFGVNAFGRLHVMGAAGGMDVMIAGPPTEQGGIDPAA